MKRILLVISLMSLISASGFSQTKRVGTVPPLVNNNGSSGISWNIRAGSAPIVIKDIGYLMYSGSYTQTIYYNTSPINNPSVGWNVNSGGWVSLGSFTATGNGSTPVSITNGQLNLVIPANTTYGFVLGGSSLPYMTYNSSFPSSFTNNNECTILIGPGIGYGGLPTSSMINHPRSFIGYVDYEILGFDNDAGVGGMPYPGIPVCAKLTDSLVFEITNPGFKTLDSCMFGWSVNDTLQTPVRFTQQLTPGAAGMLSVKFTRNLAIGDSIKAWTYLPNGKPDSLASNDTLWYVAVDGMSGTYHIGGSSPDFANLDTAIKEINRRGVCSAVKFILHDATNTADTPIQEYFGTSASNTLTIESASGDPTTCFITDTSSNAVNNYILEFNGGTNIIVKNVTVSNGNVGSYSGVVLLEHSSNLSFDNCRIISSYSGSSANAYLVTSSNDRIVDGLHFNNCYFEGGSWGIYLEGDLNKEDRNIEIKNCEFKNTYRSAIWVSKAIGLKISNNYISSNSLHTGSAAINMDEVTGYSEVYGNFIPHDPDWPLKGLRINNSSGLSTQHSLIMNNSFSIGDTTSVSTQKLGIELTGVGFFDVKFNTVAVGSSNSNSSAFSIANSNGNTVVNNVFANMNSGGVAVDVSGLGSILTMNNNLLYSMSGTLGDFNGNSQASFSAWQNNTGFDANSVSEDPLFRDIDTLKICSKNADNIGTSSGLVVDWEGNLRDAINPDPGAYEYSAISGISVADQRICNGDTATFFVGAGKSDVLIWNYTDTGNVFMTPMQGTYTLTAYGECGADTTTFDVEINTLVALPADTNICSGDTLMVMASLNNATYSWSTGETGQSIGVSMPGEYYVNVVDSDGCWSTDTMEITVSSAVMLRSDTSVCSGATVELDPGTAGGTYTWFRNGTSFSTATKVFADSAGEYVVSYTDPKSCTSTDTFMLTIAAQPNARFTVNQLTNSNNVRFEAVDTTGSNYYWSFGDGKSVSGPAWFTMNKYLANGKYSVTLVMTSQLCGDSTYSKDVDVIGIGLSERMLEKGVKLYPNPVASTLNVDLTNIEEELTIEILGINGQKVFNKALVAGSMNSIELNEVLSSGTYVVNLRNTTNEIGFSQLISIK